MNNKEEVVMVYEKLLNGKAKALSQFFFQPHKMEERIKILIKYIIEEKMLVTPEEATTKLTMDVMNQYKIKGILKYIPCPDEYGPEDLAYVVYYAYPELPQPSCEELAIKVYNQVLEGKRKNFPKNYFINSIYGDTRAKTCFKYLCEDILKYDKNAILEHFGTSEGLTILSQYKLKIIMNMVYSSTTDLLENVYPGIFAEN
jgi:hypothetical protein